MPFKFIYDTIIYKDEIAYDDDGLIATKISNKYEWLYALLKTPLPSDNSSSLYIGTFSS